MEFHVREVMKRSKNHCAWLPLFWYDLSEVGGRVCVFFFFCFGYASVAPPAPTNKRKKKKNFRIHLEYVCVILAGFFFVHSFVLFYFITNSSSVRQYHCSYLLTLLLFVYYSCALCVCVWMYQYVHFYEQMKTATITAKATTTTTATATKTSTKTTSKAWTNKKEKLLFLSTISFLQAPSPPWKDIQWKFIDDDSCVKWIKKIRTANESIKIQKNFCDFPYETGMNSHMK